MEDNHVHPGVSWDSNKSSSHCSICNKHFGRILQRRHHCRYCGRLVCASCSNNRATLPNSIASSSGNTSSSNKDKDGKDDSVRVCDPCYRVLSVKKEKLTQQILQKEKKSELLKVTSFVSKSLVDVFLLDGNCKSLSYDDTTTVDQLVTSLLGGQQSLRSMMKLGLFEVKQDINNGEEYSLLPFTALINDVFTTWRDHAGEKYYPYGKLILPVDSEAMLQQFCQQQLQFSTQSTAPHFTPHVPLTPTFNLHSSSSVRARSSFGLAGEETAQTGSDGGELSDEVFVLRNKLEDSQKEIERLNGLLEKTQRKLEVCKSVLIRSKKPEDWLPDTPNPPAPTATTTNTSPGGETLYEESNTSSMNNNGVTRSNVRRESWYNPFKTSKKVPSSGVPPSTPTPTQTTEEDASRMSMSDVFSTPASTCVSQHGSENYYPEERQLYATDATNNTAGKGFALHAMEEEILSAPARYLLKSSNEQAQFIRTFFHHVDSLEHFLARYALFFQHVQPALSSQYQQEQHRATGLAESLTGVYHMGVALDTLYLRALALSETTRPALRAWLLQLLPVITRLPVADADSVTRLVRCLAKEDVLCSSGVQAVLHRQIELACLHRLMFDSASQCVRLLYEEEEDGNHISWSPRDNDEESGPVVSPGKQLTTIVHFVTKHTTSPNPTPVPALTFPVLNQLMVNLLNTFCYVLSDYTNLLPPQHNLLNQYLITSYTCFNQLIKPQYRYAVGNGTITLTEAYGIFLFLHQHVRQLGSLGSGTQSGNRGSANNVAAGTFEDGYLLRIVEQMRAKKVDIRNICLFALKTEWERLVKERLGLSGTKKVQAGGAAGEGTGLGLDLVNPVDYYASFLGSGTGASSLEDAGDGPVFPLCRWVSEVMQFLATLTGVLSRTNLFQDANQDLPGPGGLYDDDESGAGSGADDHEDDEVLRALRLSMLCALFDHLHSLAPLLEEHFVAVFACTSTTYTPSDKTTAATGHHIALLGEVNSCLVFLMQLTEYYLSLTLSPALSLNTPTSSSTPSSSSGTSPLEEKYLAICDQFHGLVLRLVGLHCGHQWKHDLVSVLESGGLLRRGSNWEQDMVAVVQAKKLHKVYANLVSQYVLTEEFVSGAGWSTGLLAESGGQCLLPGFLQLVASVRLQYLALSTSSLVSHYLEALLTSQYCLPTATSSSVMNVSAFNARLMEDLQMIVAFVEEVRVALFFPAHAPHFIRTTPDPSSKPRKLLTFGRKQQSNSTPSVAPSGVSWQTSNQPSSMSSALESKEVLEEYLSPLTHVICALNMSRRDLVSFTQQELYGDFGYQNALRLWQVLLTWRQEKKEHIQQDYDNYFKAWLPPVVAQHSDKIKYSLPFLAKLKIANVVKLSSTNALLTGGFPSSNNNNNNSSNAGSEWDSQSEVSGSFRGSFTMSSSSFRFN